MNNTKDTETKVRQSIGKSLFTKEECFYFSEMLTDDLINEGLILDGMKESRRNFVLTKVCSFLRLFFNEVIPLRDQVDELVELREIDLKLRKETLSAYQATKQKNIEIDKQRTEILKDKLYRFREAALELLSTEDFMVIRDLAEADCKKSITRS